MHNTIRRVSLTILKQLFNLFYTFFIVFRDLVAELPFILMHPKPEDDENTLASERSPNRLSIDRRISHVGQQNDNENHTDPNKNHDESPNLIQLDG